MGAKSRHLGRSIALAICCIIVVAGIDSLGISKLAGGSVGPVTHAPLAPVSVNAVQSGADTDLKISWTYSVVAPVATGAIVQLYQAASGSAKATFLTQLVCGASCTSVTFRDLNLSVPYQALVWPTIESVPGAPMGSPIVTLTSSCSVGACVSLNATQTIGPANHAASGILHSVYAEGNDEADLAALDTTMFRSTPTYNADGSFNWSSWNVAVAAGAKTTLVLSDLWSAANGANPPTPWSNWSAYSSWVTSTVSAILQSGEQVNYWEPYNEPGGTGYYSAANQATVTTPLLLQQFLVAYQAIRAADPTAAVIGPSIAEWSDYPNQWGTTSAPNPMPDMVTFLNYAVANNIQLAAISWHEIVDNAGPNPTENTLLPVNIEDHVAEARALIAARPSLGSPQIFINEYGMPEVQLIPGWDVAYLSALTAAGVNSAGRTCWYTNCANPTLDALLSNNGTSPWNSYYDRLIYASMSGNMIEAASSSDFVTALGSYNSSSSTVTGLVGRGQGCTEESWCTASFPGNTLAPPTTVRITVTVPWSSGTAEVALTNVPGQNLGPVSTPPSAVDSTVPVTAAGPGEGTVTLTIPSFLDGDAYGFTITPSP
jgi:hypothetical protein